MQEFVIICDMYGGISGKYSPNPTKTALKLEYDKFRERHLFMENWERKKSDDAYYDNIRTFLVDYDKVSITELTDRFEELKNAI